MAPLVLFYDVRILLPVCTKRLLFSELKFNHYKIFLYKIILNYYNITFIFLYFHLQCAVRSTWQSPMRCVIYSGALEIKFDNLQCAQCAENLQGVF